MRRLAEMVERRLIRKSGMSRAARFFVDGVEPPRSIPPSLVEPGDLFTQPMPLSKKAVKVQRYLRNPRHGREIVGYEREFLDGYRPNVTGIPR